MKGRTYTYWIWALVVFTVVVLIVYFYPFNKRAHDDTHVHALVDLIDIHENNAVVLEYVDFVKKNTDEMNLSHAYSNEAIIKLADATNAMAQEIGYEIKGDLDTAKMYVNLIVNDPLETTHADNIKKGTVIITNILDNMQQSKYPELKSEVNDLKNACDSINPDILTLDQKSTVNSYLNKAANLLVKMN